jgi:hypothetical protein
VQLLVGQVTLGRFALMRQLDPVRGIGRQMLDSRINGGLWGCECSDDTITGVAEQKTAMSFDRGAQHVVVSEQGRPHPVRVFFPPTG